jgi:hypothetical protein
MSLLLQPCQSAEGDESNFFANRIEFEKKSNNSLEFKGNYLKEWNSSVSERCRLLSPQLKLFARLHLKNLGRTLNNSLWQSRMVNRVDQ